jgi:RNA-directed DNA polymerase
MNDWSKMDTRRCGRGHSGLFDSIPHENRMARVKEYMAEGKLLSILDSWLYQDIMTEMEKW